MKIFNLNNTKFLVIGLFLITNMGLINSAIADENTPYLLEQLETARRNLAEVQKQVKEVEKMAEHSKTMAEEVNKVYNDAFGIIGEFNNVYEGFKQSLNRIQKLPETAKAITECFKAQSENWLDPKTILATEASCYSANGSVDPYCSNEKFYALKNKCLSVKCANTSNAEKCYAENKQYCTSESQEAYTFRKQEQEKTLNSCWQKIGILSVSSNYQKIKTVKESHKEKTLIDSELLKLIEQATKILAKMGTAKGSGAKQDLMLELQALNAQINILLTRSTQLNNKVDLMKVSNKPFNDDEEMNRIKVKTYRLYKKHKRKCKDVDENDYKLVSKNWIQIKKEDVLKIPIGRDRSRFITRSLRVEEPTDRDEQIEFYKKRIADRKALKEKYGYKGDQKVYSCLVDHFYFMGYDPDVWEPSY